MSKFKRPDLVGQRYLEVADFPDDKPMASDGKRLVFKGVSKVYLVIDGIIIDCYHWELFECRHVQKEAQAEWKIYWWYP